MTKKATHSVKYGLTYKGLEDSLDEKEGTIVYHTVRDGWDTDCGRDTGRRLPRRPTGKRYRFCGTCRKQQAKA